MFITFNLLLNFKFLPMNISSRKAGLKELDKKLAEYRTSKDIIPEKHLKISNDGWRMVIELVTGMILGVSIGVALDFLFGTQPIFLIIFSLLGFMAGVKTMMTTAKKINQTHQ